MEQPQITAASEQAFGEFNPAELASINQELTGEPAPAESAPAQAPEPVVDAAPPAVEEQVADVPVQAPKPEQPKAEQGRPEETSSFRAVREAAERWETKAKEAEASLSRFETYQPLHKVADEVGVETLENVSYFVTSPERDPVKFADGFIEKLIATDPARYEAFGQRFIERSIELSPDPIIEDLLEKHWDKVAEKLGSKGLSLEDARARLTGTAVDDDLIDEPVERKAGEETDVSKLPPWARTLLEKANSIIERDEQRETQTKESSVQTLANSFVTESFKPFEEQARQAGLLILPGDSETEQAAKRTNLKRIYDEVYQSAVKSDLGQLIATEYLEKGVPVPGYRMRQAQALVEKLTNEAFAYHVPLITNRQEKQASNITKPTPQNIPGNHQGSALPTTTPPSVGYGREAFGDDAALAEETRALLT